MKRIRAVLKNERGSLIVELCMVCTILIIFFMFMAETALYIKDVIHIQQVAREGAREASIISSTPRFSNPVEAGQMAAADCMNTYFTNDGSVTISRVNGSFTCTAQYQHEVFCMNGITKTIEGTAIYPDFGQ